MLVTPSLYMLKHTSAYLHRYASHYEEPLKRISPPFYSSIYPDFSGPSDAVRILINQEMPAKMQSKNPQEKVL